MDPEPTPTDYTDLFEAHWGDVVRIALSVLGPGHRGDAEDLAQDVFVEAFARLGQLRNRRAFGAWVRRIAWRRAIDRRRLARWARPHLWVEPADGWRTGPVAGAGGDQEEELAVRRAMERLPDRHRAVLYMFYWLGMGVAEIAETLGTPEGTVKSLLSRGRRRIARELEPPERV